jgi:hypothetical protein
MVFSLIVRKRKRRAAGTRLPLKMDFGTTRWQLLNEATLNFRSLGRGARHGQGAMAFSSALSYWRNVPSFVRVNGQP